MASLFLAKLIQMYNTDSEDENESQGHEVAHLITLFGRKLGRGVLPRLAILPHFPLLYILA